MIVIDTLKRLTSLRDHARDEYRDLTEATNFGELTRAYIGIDIARDGWAIICDDEAGIANFLLDREIVAAAVIQRIAPALGLTVCAAPAAEAAE